MIAVCLRGAAAAACLLLTSCPKPKPATGEPQRVVTVFVASGCLTEPRPEPEASFAAIVMPDGEARYPPKDAVIAALYMAALDRWIDNAIADCGSPPAQDAGVDAPPQEK